MEGNKLEGTIVRTVFSDPAETLILPLVLEAASQAETCILPLTLKNCPEYWKVIKLSELLSKFTIRPATTLDAPALFQLIQALAEYEKLSHAVTGNEETLKAHLFGERPYAEALIAESETRAVGYALFFYNYSTFLTKPGIYLEDLFVLPEYRQRGIGTALIKSLGKIAVERNFGRLEWSVLDWNQPAIDFYKNLGASVLPDWRICRITGDSLKHFAEN